MAEHQEPMQHKRYLSIKQLAGRYGVTPKTIYQWLKKEFPQPMKFGNRSRWPLSAIVKWEAQRPKGVTQ